MRRRSPSPVCPTPTPSVPSQAARSRYQSPLKSSGLFSLTRRVVLLLLWRVQARETSRTHVGSPVRPYHVDLGTQQQDPKSGVLKSIQLDVRHPCRSRPCALYQPISRVPRIFLRVLFRPRRRYDCNPVRPRIHRTRTTSSGRMQPSTRMEASRCVLISRIHLEQTCI